MGLRTKLNDLSNLSSSMLKPEEGIAFKFSRLFTGHAKVRLYVGQGGSPTVHEALWAGLPIVGLPLVEDMMDNMLLVETKGAGLALDIASLTPEILSQTILRVMKEPE